MDFYFLNLDKVEVKREREKKIFHFYYLHLHYSWCLLLLIEGYHKWNVSGAMGGINIYLCEL
jgi:hypothetical protein